MPFSYASCQDTFSHFISVCSYVIPTSDDLLAAGLTNGDYVCKLAIAVGQWDDSDRHQRDSWAPLSRPDTVPYRGTKAS